MSKPAPEPPQPDTLIPPNDLDAEGAVISYAITTGTVPLAKLEPKHFYADANGRIYAAILDTLQAGEPLDIIAVARRLNDAGRLAQCGGSPYLAMLADCIPHCAEPFAAAHSEAIIERWKRRVLIDTLLEARVKLGSGELDSQAAWEFVKGRSRELAEVDDRVP